MCPPNGGAQGAEAAAAEGRGGGNGIENSAEQQQQQAPPTTLLAEKPSFTLQQLHPHSRYRIGVAARTETGAGERVTREVQVPIIMGIYLGEGCRAFLFVFYFV
jgi:hypothetical protein